MRLILLLGSMVTFAGCDAQGSQFGAVNLDPSPVPGAYAETMVTTKMPVGEQPRIETRQKDHCLKDGPDPARHELTEKSDRLCIGPPLKFADGRISGSRQCLWSSDAPYGTRCSSRVALTAVGSR